MTEFLPSLSRTPPQTLPLQRWGAPYRALVVRLGVTIAILSITGIIIWLRKRSAVAIREQRGVKAAVLHMEGRKTNTRGEDEQSFVAKLTSLFSL